MQSIFLPNSIGKRKLDNKDDGSSTPKTKERRKVVAVFGREIGLTSLLMSMLIFLVVLIITRVAVILKFKFEMGDKSERSKRGVDVKSFKILETTTTTTTNTNVADTDEGGGDSDSEIEQKKIAKFDVIIEYKDDGDGRKVDRLERFCMKDYVFSKFTQLCVEKDVCMGKQNGVFVLADGILHVCDGKDSFARSYLCPSDGLLQLDDGRTRILCGNGRNPCEFVGDTRTLFADPQSTFSYIKCKHGVGVMNDCPTNHYFSPVYKNCQIIPRKCIRAAERKNKINTVLFGRSDTICKFDGHSNIVSVESVIAEEDGNGYGGGGGGFFRSDCKSKEVASDLIPELWNNVSPYYYGCVYDEVEQTTKYTLTQCGAADGKDVEDGLPLNYIEPLHERVAHLSAMYFEFPQIRTKVFIKDRGCVTFDYKAHYKNGEVPLVYRYPLHTYHHLPLYKYSFASGTILPEDRTSNDLDSLDYTGSRFERPSGFKTQYITSDAGDDSVYYGRGLSGEIKAFGNRNKKYISLSSTTNDILIDNQDDDESRVDSGNKGYGDDVNVKVGIQLCSKQKVETTVEFLNILVHREGGDVDRWAIFTCLNSRLINTVSIDSDDIKNGYVKLTGCESSVRPSSNMFEYMCADTRSTYILFGVPFRNDISKDILPYRKSQHQKYAIGHSFKKFWVVSDRMLSDFEKSDSNKLDFKHLYCSAEERRDTTFAHHGLFAIFRCSSRGDSMAEYVKPFVPFYRSVASGPIDIETIADLKFDVNDLVDIKSLKSFQHFFVDFPGLRKVTENKISKYLQKQKGKKNKLSPHTKRYTETPAASKIVLSIQVTPK
jgi:hypothetical protein